MDAKTEEKEQLLLLELHRWHLRRFVSLGFGRGEAEALELAGVDWHEAADLLKHGCSHQTAVEILI